MQIVNDNLKCKDDDIKYIATRLKNKFDNYVHWYEKETRGRCYISSLYKRIKMACARMFIFNKEESKEGLLRRIKNKRKQRR